MKKITLLTGFFALVFVLATILAPETQAEDNITDWYIQKFDTEITVNTDSSLDITERITADCGNLPDKRGIFRILPTVYSPEKGNLVNTPIELKSITDFQGNNYKYSTSNNRIDHTVTWKIGNPNKIVQGVNNYQIKYHVKNTIRFANNQFDEFYWNLNGNFWQMEIDSFSATINFPAGINKDNTQLNLYTGTFGEKNQNASLEWLSPSQLKVTSTKVLNSSEGITLSATFPKNVIMPYQPTFWEKYGSYFYLLIPILVLILCYQIWLKYGRDPKINPIIVPEFEIPEKLAPLEMGMVYTDGILKTNFISAALINLAVKGMIKIEEIQKGKIFKSKDYKLHLLSNPKAQINDAEKMLLDKVFGGAEEVELSSLKNEFYKEISGISKKLTEELKAKNLLIPRSRTLQIVFFVVAIGVGILAGVSVAWDIWLTLALAISAVIIIIFGIIMPQRTLEGLKLFKRIQGFRMYMEKAEKYRQRFNEKENIFEKFLPYAIVFGMTELWIRKMQEIYGKEYFNSYVPVWYAGHGFSHFDVDTLNSAISGLSSSMASTLASSPSGSGSGGGGFSGGGGGGGGGGGW